MGWIDLDPDSHEWPREAPVLSVIFCATACDTTSVKVVDDFMVYDPIGRRVLLVGSRHVRDGGNAEIDGKTIVMSWDGSVFREVIAGGPRRGGNTRHCSTKREEGSFVTGGLPYVSPDDSIGPTTWELAGDRWELPEAQAGPRRLHTMVYDPARAAILQYGGYGEDRLDCSEAHCQQTWSYERQELVEARATRARNLASSVPSAAAISDAFADRHRRSAPVWRRAVVRSMRVFFSGSK